MAPPGNRHASTLPAQPATDSRPSPIPALNGSRSPSEQTRSCAQASSRAPAVPFGTDQSAIIQAYEAWLRERRVRWATACMKLTSGGVISGWGYIATQRIEKGKEICRVPRAACFGSTASADIEPPALDSQQRIALLMYKELQLSSKSTWAPFLEILTGKPASPWCWPADAQRFLEGTELEHVLQEKLRRLEAERKSCGVQGMDAGEYRRLCALVASTTNPWFGGSIVPFNWTLNYARHPNVSFEVSLTTASPP
uniref:SET domain-containing protein n=1 Tax=Chrysotila carterae TaxID=13221 RepID=A0A7S4B3J5_CHRCT|mmetsp:Transcript_7607/g.16804  ORF Transcript_7607/g.16804 Transcript_7607/m.16804 type:complete len:254 (+) Transcript_7607:38-799(+)